MGAIPYPDASSLTLTIDGNGEWFLDGKRVENTAVKAFFHRSLVRGANKRFELLVGEQRARVIIANTPAFARRVTGITDPDTLGIQCLCGREFRIRPDSLRYLSAKGYFVARRMEDGLAVKFLRTASQDLIPYLDEDDSGNTCLAIHAARYPVRQA